jgi:drug/metabolite transporter (DMT)-like permease
MSLASISPGATSLRSPAVLLAFACVYLIWGTTYLGIAVAIETLPPFTSGALRFLLAAALMYAGLRLRRPRPLQDIDWRYALLCGVLLTGIGNGLVVWAQQGVPSGIAALMVASIPVFVLAINWLFFEKRAPSLAAATGIALAVIGVAVIVMHTRTLAGHAQPWHIAALLFAVFSWSIGTLLQKRLVGGQHVFAFTCAQIFFGGMFQLMLALLNAEWRVFDASQVSMASLGAVLYLVIFGSIVAFNCYAWLLARVPAQKVATYAVVNPVVALFLGAWILNEPVTPTVIGSVILVLFGVVLVLFQDRVSELFKRRVNVPSVSSIE